jgi:chemotaxis protein CheC
MEDFSLNDLNPIQTDILGEIGNIGMGNVATALSTMLDKQITISVPTVNIVNLSDLGDSLGMAEQEVVGIMFGLSEDIDGMIMFVLEESFAKEMIKTLNNDNIDELFSLTEGDISALQEVANIMAGSYLSAISSLSGLRIGMSVPYFTIDMLGSIMSVPAVQYGQVGDKVMLIEEKIVGEDRDFDCYLVLVPEVKSLKKLLDKVGSAYGFSD